MHYFVDGYNFLFFLYEEVDPLRKKREEVIATLQETLNLLNLNITIVFDSHHSKNNFFPSRSTHANLEIIYTVSKQTADQYILESLEYKKNNSQETVVTSDKFLSRQAIALGAKVMPIAAFVKWVTKKHERKLSQEVKQSEECSAEFQRLLEAFEKKLFEDL